jgi:hypothetical protein
MYSGGTGKGGGYTFYFGDGTSTACVDTGALCTTGTTAVVNPPTYSLYGAGFGIGVNTATGTALTLASGGLTWAISGSGLPANGIQIGINSASGPCSGTNGCCYRPPMSMMTGSTIPWSKFVTDCFDTTPDGGTFNSASDGLLQIKFQVISGAATDAYNYCVTSLSY